MKKPLNIKKFLLPNIPYVFIALFATKLGQAWRLAPGTDFSGKALHLMEGFAAAFQSALPSFHPIDLCVGVAAALLIRLAVYVKGKNAKKFRKNLEYGSARWGRPEDIVGTFSTSRPIPSHTRTRSDWRMTVRTGRFSRMCMSRSLSVPSLNRCSKSAAR